MTLYREFMRRLSRVGLTLMFLTFVATLIKAIMDAGAKTVYMASALSMSPVLTFYAFIGGAGLALAGFSFLNKRVESDFYHSIPVKRCDLFLSVSAAAATWLLWTVVLSAATSAVVYLVVGRPFAPLYPFMNAGYFFAASLLVFAAASIGCTITGTWFTNIIMTGLVLFLPRYILFMIGRTLIADTSIMSWLDLRGFLDPSTNAATGLIVTLSRPLLRGDLVSGIGILWSLVLALIELGAGALLFMRRPSELAEQGASNRVLQIVFASLLSLTVLLVYTVRAHVATTIFTCIILIAALAVYVVYQIIVLRNARRVLLSLPWFLCSVVVAAAIMFGSQAAAKAVLQVSPKAEEIASVRFYGEDRGSLPVSYASILCAEIDFTEEEIKRCVADALEENIASVRSYGYTYSDSNYCGTETVCIQLKNGRKLYRRLLFPNHKLLDEYRRENEAYAAAITALPPDDTVKAVESYIARSRDGYDTSYNFNSPDIRALCEHYFAEQRKDGVIIPYYLHDPDRYVDYEQYASNHYYGYTPVNEEQQIGGFGTGGYIGIKRYHDNINITLETPKTASFYMRLSNQFAEDPSCKMLAAAYAFARSEDFLTLGQYFSLDLQLLNCPVTDGNRQWVSCYWYAGRDDNYDSVHQFPDFLPKMDELVQILQRGSLTDDPTKLCVMPSYSLQYEYGDSEYMHGNCYLAFSPEDEAALLEIIGQWCELTMAQEHYAIKGVPWSGAGASTDEPTTEALPWPSPTPTPARPAPMPSPAG